MKLNFSISDHHLGERIIPVIVTCDMKTRHINFNTVFTWWKSTCRRASAEFVVGLSDYSFPPFILCVYQRNEF